MLGLDLVTNLVQLISPNLVALTLPVFLPAAPDASDSAHKTTAAPAYEIVQPPTVHTYEDVNISQDCEKIDIELSANAAYGKVRK